MEQIKDENTPLVDEALQYLNQAVENRPNYDDAMAYLNLVYRRKADLDYGDDAARKDDLAKAEEWRTKAMGTRKANEEKKEKGPGGITMDSSGNLK
jgi:tetratricopeptide (TPR) repeat protein